MRLSVIIPVYNQELLVIRALQSIPNRKDIEIIVIDDGSTDNTWNNLQAYTQTSDQNIICLYNEKNMGVGHTVNKGYDNAQGEYIVLLGSDDYFYTDELNFLIDMLDGTDLTYFDVRVNNGDVWELNNDSKHVLCGSFKVMKRSFIGNTRCAEDRRSGEDLPFYKELLSKKPTEKFTHIIAKHYNHPRDNSLTDLVRKGIIDV